jgi:hypothetical protein
VHDTWRSLSILPPGMPLARRWLAPFSSREARRQLPVVVRGHHLRPLTSTQKGAQGVTRGGQSDDPTSYYEGDNDKDVGDSDEELIAATEREVKHQAWLPTDQFEKLLDATYPNHTYPVGHKLKECTMMKNHMTTGTFTRVNKPEGDLTGKTTTPFPKEKAAMLMYGGLGPMNHIVSSNLPADQSTP